MWHKYTKTDRSKTFNCILHPSTLPPISLYFTSHIFPQWERHIFSITFASLYPMIHNHSHSSVFLGMFVCKCVSIYCTCALYYCVQEDVPCFPKNKISPENKPKMMPFEKLDFSNGIILPAVQNCSLIFSVILAWNISILKHF